MNRSSKNIFAALASLILSGAAINAQAHCDGNHTGDHPHCAGGGGNPEEETIRVDIPGVLGGDGVEGSAETIDLLPLDGSGSPLEVNLTQVLDGSDLASDGLTQNIANEFNTWCDLNARNGEDVPTTITATPVGNDADVSVGFSSEQDGNVTVVVSFSEQDENYTLLLQAPGLMETIPHPGSPPVTVTLTHWNLRGGGKGKNKRCQPGSFDLLDSLILTVTNPAP